ncbi:Major facilitator superfamily (MFS) profile domain-containing protein [Caenorhabditis elegans]|uniref:Major facilitator superfamily (MFS) profile domain-containing protein n=1 Tax=Caenorhabditis elegans TaxID=6239 RepID=Q8I4F6_CAEEL|nr:Major facilitator superfamily (MFS) profile domain-containing protein [Caenorhabditis elegans]CAD56246.1 Major facilitator superfamily (MFS) profile domain-containing protein [Caenorhabditis elegans]|eukprot:NP_503071.2 SLC (SoLute Carrier) homolog [Caenorhabditis elegans]
MTLDTKPAVKRVASKPDVKKFPFFHPFSRRLHICLLCMAGFCCTTFMRMHIAISMTCMINSTALALESAVFPEAFENSSSIFEELEPVSNGACSSNADVNKKVVVDYGGQLVWNSQEQNLIFSGTFWGSIITVLPSMFFINRYSPRYVLQAAVGCYILMTAITPYIATRFGPYPVFISRVIMGLGEGFILPANNAILANWFPSAERSTAISLFTTGNQMAGAGGNPVAASLCASSFGWPSIFYFASIVSTIWSVCWFLTASNQPSKCKVMTKTERDYLDANVVRRSNKTNRSLVVPYSKILKSPAFLAQLLCQFVINFIVTLLQIYLPNYFKDVLHLGVIANGTYTSVPNIVNFALKIVWGITIDRAKEKKIISGTFGVKLSQSIANFGGALFLILITYFVDCTNPTLGFVFFCMMYGCMGTLVSGFYTSLLSLAPKYTATMSSISVFCAMMGRLATPAIVGLIKKQNTLSEWQTLFLVCAAANIICGAVFLVFGSGELQEWGLEDEAKEMKTLAEKTPLASIQNLPADTEDQDIFQSALDMEIPEIQLNEITLTTEERQRFQRRIREDSMCL